MLCLIYNVVMQRDVAQLGSAPRSGRGGRRFKSCHPDFCDLKATSLGGSGTIQVVLRPNTRGSKTNADNFVRRVAKVHWCINQPPIQKPGFSNKPGISDFYV